MSANANNSVTEYDGDLQMFRVQPREPDLEMLRFLRWLADHEQLEHGVAGPPHGELATIAAPTRYAALSRGIAVTDGYAAT